MPPWTSPLQSWGSRLPEINYLIAFAYQTDSHREQAREYYQRQLGLVPGHLASLLGAGTVALDESRFKDSEGFLQSVLARAPDHVQANYEWGLLRFKTHQYDQAIEVFNRVLRLRPDHTQAEYYRCLALSRTHQNAAAEALWHCGRNWKRWIERFGARRSPTRRLAQPVGRVGYPQPIELLPAFPVWLPRAELQ